MQQIAHEPVEIGRVRAVKHHLEIVAFLPVTLVAELFLDQLVELGARQWIGHAHADVVGPRLVDQPARRQDVVEVLAEITELQEEPDANSLVAQHAGARAMFSPTRRALVHGVEDLLAAAFGADPDFTATGLTQRRGHARAHEVGAQLDGEGHAAPGRRRARRRTRAPSRP